MRDKVWGGFLTVLAILSVLLGMELKAAATEQTDISSPLPVYDENGHIQENVKVKFDVSQTKTNDTQTTARKTEKHSDESESVNGKKEEIFETATTKYYPDYHTQKYYGQQLNSVAEKQMYNALVNHIKNNGASNYVDIYFSTPINIGAQTSFKDEESKIFQVIVNVQRGLDAFRFDYPHLYWTTSSSGIYNMQTLLRSNGDIHVSGISMTLDGNNTTGTDVSRAKSVINDIVEEASIKEKHYDRLKTAHDMLAERITYTGYDYNPRDFKAVGALSDGIGVCTAYAESFKMIADSMGYTNVLVAGEVNTNNGIKPHMWNCVLLDGQWYAIDVTFDDKDQVQHDFFLVGKNSYIPRTGTQFCQTHIPDGQFSLLDYERFDFPRLASESYR